MMIAGVRLVDEIVFVGVIDRGDVELMICDQR